METRKNILGGSLIAAALLAAGSINAQASVSNGYGRLGSATELRAQASGENAGTSSLELKCGAKHQAAEKTTAKKGKDGKCGEGKCGGSKKASSAPKAK